MTLTKHLSQKVLLKIDLENFFPSISINWVINYFTTLGYSKKVAYYLAALCCHEEVLGQGAATSPYLSNILLFSLDERLSNLAKKYKLNYTRYADDMTFSGDYIPHNYISIVSQIIEKYGLKVNSEKTILHTKPGKRIVTGLSVVGDTLQIPRETKRQIKKDIHFIEKYGYLSHINNMRIKNPTYLYSLEGKVLFWLQIEPNNKFALHGLKIIRNIINF